MRAAGKYYVIQHHSIDPYDTQFHPAPSHAVWASDPAWTNPGDGQPVDSWRNTSGSHPTAAGGARPTFRLSTAAFNGQSTVQFVRASSQQVVAAGIANTTQPFKGVLVFQSTSTGVLQIAMGGLNNASASLGEGRNASDQWYSHHGSFIVGGTADTSPHVMRFTASGASSQIWIDEASIVSGNANTGNYVNLALGGGYGSGGATGNFLNGHIAYAALYPGATSDAALTALCRGFGAFYGIAVA